jgi:hypothetical protein
VVELPWVDEVGGIVDEVEAIVVLEVVGGTVEVVG